MERAFIVTKESKYFKSLEQYDLLRKQQIDFIDKFFKEKGIEATEYYMHGDGMVNCPFSEYEMDTIGLGINPTEKDVKKFGKILGKKDSYGLQHFRKNSKLAKEFKEKCINEQAIVNLYEPRVGEYFKDLFLNKHSTERFKMESQIYIKLESDNLTKNETPEGFIEIKLSEYYATRENLAS